MNNVIINEKKLSRIIQYEKNLLLDFKKSNFVHWSAVEHARQYRSQIRCSPCTLTQGLLKDGQESFSKIYKLFFRRYMPEPH